MLWHLRRRCVSRLVEYRRDEASTRAKLAELLGPLKKSDSAAAATYYNDALALCGILGPPALADGKFVEAHISAHRLDRDHFLANAVVYMYGKCGSCADAQRAFDCLRRPDSISWNALIAAYAQNGHSRQAIMLFRRMQHAGDFVLASTLHTVFNACARLEDAAGARAIRAAILGTSLQCDENCNHALLNTYRKCGTLQDVEQLFEVLPKRSVITWTIFVSAYAQVGHLEDAMYALRRMQLDGVHPNKITFSSVLEAWGHDDDQQQQQQLLESLRKLHEQIRELGLDKDIVVGTSLVDMYTKCGSIEEARSAFDAMSSSDVVSWTAIILAYVKFSQGSEALRLFKMMQHEGVRPNYVTCMISLNACTTASKLREGRSIHDKIIEAGFDSQVFVGNALVTMYGSCGVLGIAKRVFYSLQQRDRSSWNTLMAAFAQHGHSIETLDLFWLMLQDGQDPDSITLVTVLSACSCAGMLDEGHGYYRDMILEHELLPKSEHVGCILDLFTKVGRLEEAEEMLQLMPSCDLDEKKWVALLAACRVYGDVARGKRATEHILNMSFDSSSAYILMSSIFSESGETLELELPESHASNWSSIFLKTRNLTR